MPDPSEFHETEDQREGRADAMRKAAGECPELDDDTRIVRIDKGDGSKSTELWRETRSRMREHFGGDDVLFDRFCKSISNGHAAHTAFAIYRLA